MSAPSWRGCLWFKTGRRQQQLAGRNISIASFASGWGSLSLLNHPFSTAERNTSVCSSKTCNSYRISSEWQSGIFSNSKDLDCQKLYRYRLDCDQKGQIGQGRNTSSCLRLEDLERSKSLDALSAIGQSDRKALGFQSQVKKAENPTRYGSSIERRDWSETPSGIASL